MKARKRKTNKRNLKGKKFGYLTPTGDCFVHETNGHKYWRCVCACGGERVVRGADLRSGKIEDCGCLMTTTGRPGIGFGRRYDVRVPVGGVTKTMSELAAESGLSYTLLRRRYLAGIRPEDLTLPLRSVSRKQKVSARAAADEPGDPVEVFDFVAAPSGDGHGFCWDVTSAEFERLMGRQPGPEHKSPFSDNKYLLYPGEQFAGRAVTPPCGPRDESTQYRVTGHMVARADGAVEMMLKYLPLGEAPAPEDRDEDDVEEVTIAVDW